MTHKRLFPSLLRRLPLGVGLLAIGCTVGPDYRRPAVAVPEEFKEDVHWRAGTLGQSPPASDADTMACAAGKAWWQPWNDTLLDSLEQRALQSNATLQIAEADYARSRALVDIARAALMPTVSADLAAQRNRIADYQNSRKSFTYYSYREVHALASARWEIDLWGGSRRGLEAADASANADAATRDAVALSVTAALADAYLLLRQTDLDLGALAAEKDHLAKLAEMTRQARRQGLATDDDVLQAENALSQLETGQAQAVIARAQAEHAVAAVLGTSPAAFSIAPIADYPLSLPDVAAVLPSALLERRPDIVAAEREVAAANARIGQAKAAFFPDITLEGGIGSVAGTLAQVLSAPARVWSFGPALAAPLFEGGALEARVNVARAEYDAAVASYRGTVLSAFQEVEDRLTERREYDRIVHSSRDALRRTGRIEHDIRRQRELGLATESDALKARIAWLEARRRWYASTAGASLSRVALVKAIGGGLPRCARPIAGTRGTSQ